MIKYVFIQNEPFLLPKVLDKYLRDHHDTTAGVNIQSVAQGKRSVFETAMELRRLYGFGYFQWKLRKYLVKKREMGVKQMGVNAKRAFQLLRHYNLQNSFYVFCRNFFQTAIDHYSSLLQHCSFSFAALKFFASSLIIGYVSGFPQHFCNISAAGLQHF